MNFFGTTSKKWARMTAAGLLAVSLLLLPGCSSDFGGGLASPKVARAAANPWQIRSIDTQVVSKHWQNVPADSIAKQVAMLKALGVSHIAIGTPYDRPVEMQKWADAIHNAGLKVWFRSHWLAWEGDDGTPKGLSTVDYLSKTKAFILANPMLFQAGDAFTVCVEPENGGVGTGQPMADWAAYNKFIRDGKDIADAAFAAIGLGGQVQTNLVSANGWIADNALEKATVDKLGLITLDHYVGQDNASMIVAPEEMAARMSSDLDRYYAKWQVPIMIGEWGYHRETEVPDLQQKEATEATFKVFAGKPYVIGVSYWTHMGHHPRIINDSSGTPTTTRPAAEVIKAFFTATSTPPPPPPTSTGKTLATFDSGLDGFDNGKVVSGLNSTGALQLSNAASSGVGARKYIGGINLNFTTIELDINLRGAKLLPGDASHLYIDQGGQKAISLSDYVVQGQNGWQHLSIPLSKFTGLNLNSDAAYIGFRFWNSVAASYDIDNLVLVNR